MAASSRLFDPKNENLATEAYARANTSFRPALTLYVLLEWTPTPWKRKKNQKYCSKKEKLLSAYSFLVSLNDNWYTCGLNIGCYMRERTRDVELKQTAWTGGWGKRGKLSELARCNGKPIDVNSPGTFLPSVGKQKEREGDGEWERGMKMLMKSTVNECKFIFELLSSSSIWPNVVDSCGNIFQCRWFQIYVHQLDLIQSHFISSQTILSFLSVSLSFSIRFALLFSLAAFYIA